MDYKDLSKQLKEQKILPVYLFHGSEAFIKQRMLTQLIELTIGGADSLNLQRYDEMVSTQTVLESCETLPFFADRRMVIWQDPNVLTAKSSATAQDQDEDTNDEEVAAPKSLANEKKDLSKAAVLERYLASPSPTTCLVLLVRGQVDARNRIVRKLREIDAIVEFNALSSEETARWVRQTLTREHKQITNEALETLLYLGGRQLSRLYEELQKLVSYMGYRPEIQLEDVEHVMTPTTEFTVFQMLDLIGQRRMDQAMQMLDHLLRSGERAFSLLALLGRHLRHLYYVKIMTEQGIPAPRIQQALQVQNFVYRKAATQAQQFTLDGLRTAIKHCLNTDVALKSGELSDDRLAIENVILSFIL